MNTSIKPKCRELEPLFTSYVDGEAASPERASVEAHLERCPPCRDRVAGERAARDVLHARREGLRASASDALRTRCAAQCAARRAVGARARMLTRRALLPLSLAATLLLAVAGIFIFGLGSEVEALAAQLAIDHKACVQFTPGNAALDAASAARDWETRHGWPLKLPAGVQSERLELVAARRCISSRGGAAHLIYRWHGQPLSLYVINQPLDGLRDRARGGAMFESVEKLGEHTVIWSKGERTYAIVARASTSDLMQVAAYVRQAAE
jgi:anti-sigma factor RsiW